MSLLSRDRVSRHASQGMKFIICGLIGAVMEFSILKVLVGHYQITPFLSYIPSALIPAIFVFYFNRNVTFKAVSGKKSDQTRRFAMMYTIAFLINYALSTSFFAIGSAHVVGLDVYGLVLTLPRVAYLAKAAAIGVTAVFNYIMSHFFIFRRDKMEVQMAADAAVF